MSDVKCPKCRGDLATSERMDDEGVHWFLAECDPCRFTGPEWTDAAMALEACRHLAYFDPRERLPTEAENQALRDLHGDGVRWKARAWDCECERWGTEEELGEWGLAMWRGRASWPFPFKVRCYPTLDDRPIAWPEVKP